MRIAFGWVGTGSAPKRAGAPGPIHDGHGRSANEVSW